MISDIKASASFSHIPVVIITTAPLVPFAERCKKLGACAYFTKPDTFLDYKDFGENIYDDLKQCLENPKLNYHNASYLREHLIRKLLPVYECASQGWQRIWDGMALSKLLQSK